VVRDYVLNLSGDIISVILDFFSLPIRRIRERKCVCVNGDTFTHGLGEDVVNLTFVFG
jgi:hypothetical protein